MGTFPFLKDHVSSRERLMYYGKTSCLVHGNKFMTCKDGVFSLAVRTGSLTKTRYPAREAKLYMRESLTYFEKILE